MTEQEYKQKRRECFVKFCKDNGIDQEVSISIFDAFDQIFDRAYALGKQENDAEGDEEMLCVKAKTIHEMYAANQRIMKDFRGSIDGINADLINHILRQLFGSKCLPDETCNVASKEPKPAEPKFKEGDRAIYCIPEKQRIKARVVNVRQRSGSTLFNTLFNYDILLDDGRTANWVDEQWLLPDNDDQVRAVTEKDSERFDKILAKDLRKEKRLRIATQLMAAMMSNPVFNKSITVEDEDDIVHGSLEYADALIAAAEKGGGNA